MCLIRKNDNLINLSSVLIAMKWPRCVSIVKYLFSSEKLDTLIIVILRNRSGEDSLNLIKNVISNN